MSPCMCTHARSHAHLQAANELSERLVESLGAAVAEKVYSGTFHSLAAKMLRQGAFALL